MNRSHHQRCTCISSGIPNQGRTKSDVPKSRLTLHSNLQESAEMPAFSYKIHILKDFGTIKRVSYA